MQALIIGASGVVGWWLGRALNEQGWTVVGGFRNPPKQWPWGTAVRLDLTVPATVEQAITTAAPNVVFHLGALTDIETCEANPNLARQINTIGCKWVGKAADTVGARVCYLSTDYVFDGQEAPYSETSPTNALNCYGQTKKAGEAALTLAHPDPLIIRASHFGLHPRRPTELSQLIKRLKTRQTIQLRADCWSTPLSSLALAEALVTLAPGAGGTRHLPGEPVSQFDWGLAVAAAVNADPTLIQPLGLPQARPENPLSAGSLNRGEPSVWYGGRTEEESGQALRPLDTRLSTIHPWTPPTISDDLQRLLTAFDAR